MRVLIVHNQLWAHYKSNLFTEIHRNLKVRCPEAEFQVVQIGLYESSRQQMQAEDQLYDYPYTVLFQKSLDEIRFFERLKALFKAFKDFKPTVLNITGYYDWAQVLLMLFAKWKGVKVILSSESSNDDQYRNPIKEKLKSWIVTQAHAYFCFGKTSVDYLLNLGVKRHQIKVRNAAVVDDKRIREVYEHTEKTPSNVPGRFIFVGRFSPEKNLRLLLNAYQNAIQHYQNPWELLLVGDGPERKEIEKIRDNSRLTSIKLTGGVSWLEVPKWLAQADVLILPSYSEPWGLVVNEALVCGLPVIVSEKCGCSADLVEQGKNGYTFNPFDEMELSKLLMYFMNSSREERSAMGAHGQKLVNRFAVEKVASAMVDTFEKLSGRNTT